MVFDWVARLLHWLMALLLIIMFLFGMQMEELTLAERREALPMHASMGLLLLLLALFRLFWRRRYPPPPYPDSMGPGQRKWAKGVVHAFYLLMILLPIAGFLHAASYVDFEIHAFGIWNLTALLPSGELLTGVFHVIHGSCAWLLIILAIGHAGATLKHAFIDRDEIPARMLPFLRKSK
ncbi:MAG: cytochrome b [Rhodospirillaceae bacterium]|jgi:cytochrome b561|nr:cytochrome b [Rhodospirillaceae bacterium]MBT3491886.1 cytochrome b [Rhodospirillaceae bacterium]MBT3780652.1 cytochrome b [Rhodospirillaceae bacterium]MBT3978054.1 cytochrome b [Rhodospirillaceae bacterium]MBT4166726.1 cytochrome b [Rhodospirillaceae bacterium]